MNPALSSHRKEHGNGEQMKTEKKAQMIPQLETPKTPLDLWKLMGGKTRRIRQSETPSTDSLLAVYKDRFTYTFILGSEVASIHFDRSKNEIFFKGHNIKNWALTQPQIHALEGLKAILKQDERGKGLFSDYQATLDRWLADNSNRGSR